MSKKVLVMMGGFSSEREVSLVSGNGALEALKKAGYKAVAHDLKNMREFIKVLEKEKPDAVFNALHGNFGEDGTIQGFLDLMQIPYTHSGLKASSVGMNKVLTKEIAKIEKVKIVPEVKMSAGEFYKKGDKLKMPYVVKPVSDGSSVGVFIVHSKADFKKARYDNDDAELMIERFIPGRELTVMVLEGKAFVVTELKPKVEFYDYKAKYTSGMTEHVLPAEISAAAAKKCKEYAVKMHKALGCKTVSRSDFRYNPKDGVVFLEINTHPGMTPLSLVPEQARYAGISYEQLCSKLVEDAGCRKI